MGNPWSVEPEDHKIELVWEQGDISRPFWIMVKKRLTIGEEKRMLKSISRVRSQLTPSGEEPVAPVAHFEWTEYSFARAMTFLLDWSFADDKDNKMPLSRQSLESLDPDVFEILDDAIDAHEKNIKVVESKKTKASGQKPSTISAS
jgi:hypothetical protein